MPVFHPSLVPLRTWNKHQHFKTTFCLVFFGWWRQQPPAGPVHPHNCTDLLVNPPLHQSWPPQDLKMLQPLHLRQDLSTDLQRTSCLFLVEIQSLGFKGADPHSSHFTLSCRLGFNYGAPSPLQCPGVDLMREAGKCDPRSSCVINNIRH